MEIAGKAFLLVAYVVHVGDAARYGHYLSYIYHKNAWYRHDDLANPIVTEVGKVIEHKAREGAYYMLYAEESALTSDYKLEIIQTPSRSQLLTSEHAFLEGVPEESIDPELTE